MKRILVLVVLFSIAVTISAQTFKKEEPLAHTYSIVAFDPETGSMGIAVQSHWFLVGPVVCWGEAGVGVVATQSLVNITFGERGLELLKKGMSPQEAVDRLIASDEGRSHRQLAILDAKGNVATYTGEDCIEYAGHITGDNYSVQANLMGSPTVWPAMQKAYENTGGDLADRMLAALEAAEAEGGDIRGKQSAALYVYSGSKDAEPWEEKIVDIRVDDSAEPLKELRRLLRVHRAYEHMNEGDLAIEVGDTERALEEYAAAEAMFPNNLEMKYWHAVSLINNKMYNDGLVLLKSIFGKGENWREVTPHIYEAGLLDVTEEQLKEIMGLK